MLSMGGGPCEFEAERGEEASGDSDTDKFARWRLMTPFSMLAMPAMRALRFMAGLSLITKHLRAGATARCLRRQLVFRVLSQTVCRLKGMWHTAGNHGGKPHAAEVQCAYYE